MRLIPMRIFPASENGESWSGSCLSTIYEFGSKQISDIDLVRPANRDWACQTERCHTLSNKTSPQ